MATVPFRNRWSFETGSAGGTQYSLNMEPTFPVNAGNSLRVVPRFFIPYVTQPLASDSRISGIGDVQLQLLASPRAERRDGLMLGAGPMVTLATASEESIGVGRWSAGIATVALVAPARWVAGFLMTQQWSFAGDADRAPVAPFSLQPFVHYNLSGGWSVVTAPTMTAEWLAGADAIVMPIGGGFAKLFSIGGQHLSAGAEAYANPIRGERVPSWSLEVTAKLLFPSQQPAVAEGLRRTSRRR